MEPTPERQVTQEAGSDKTPLLKQKPVVAVIVGFLGLVTLSILANLGNEEPDLETGTPNLSAPPTSVKAEQVAGPQISPIDGCTLLEDSEVEEALGVLDEGHVGFLIGGGGESCDWQLKLGGEVVEGSVQLAPGDPNDFAVGAQIDGKEGVPVPGVGDFAVWFRAETGGALSVVQETDVGYLFLRVALNRPEVNDSARLEIVKGLAAAAIERIQIGPAPPIEADLCQLVTDEEAEALLAPHRLGRAAASDPLIVIANSFGLVDLSAAGDFECTRLILTEIYVRVETSSAADFEDGADFAGVVGEPVSGVGDEAVWFEGVPVVDAFASPHETGVLAIRHGDAYFRIVLALPDIELSDQLEIAKDLGAKALIRLQSGDRVVTIFETSPPDLSNMGYVDNLLAKEEAGEWTLGEGLVATLRYFAGEIGASQLLRDPDLVDNSGTGAIRLAREYVETGSDAEAKAEIIRLLDLLVIPRDELVALTAAEPPPLEVSSQLVSLGTTAQESDDCPKEWAGIACWEKVSDLDLDEMFGEDSYLLFHPEIPPGQDVAGWTNDHVFLALDAMKASALKYETLGKMPAVDIIFKPLTNFNGGTFVRAQDIWGEASCKITLNTPLQGISDEFFQQWIATAMAFCLINETYEVIARWWETGLAVYLGEWVYPSADFEHEKFPGALQQQELETTLFHRSHTNWAFFEDLHTDGGVGNSLNLIAHLQGKDLASWGGIENSFHNFKRHLTDGLVLDIGGFNSLYSPEARQLTFSGPHVVLEEVTPFGVSRLHVTVPSGKVACVTYDEQGELRSSWRKGRPGGSGGGWTGGDLPTELKGESVFLVTATQPGAQFNMDVSKVPDEDDGCEEEEQGSGDAVNCLIEDICGPTGYYLYWEQLPDWFKDTFGG